MRLNYASSEESIIIMCLWVGDQMMPQGINRNAQGIIKE